MDSEEKKKIKTSLVFDPDLWADFRVQCARKQVDQSAEIARLIEKDLRGSLVHSHEELHELLDEILQQGAGRHIEAISQILEMVAFALRLGGRYTLEEMRALRKHLSKVDPKN